MHYSKAVLDYWQHALPYLRLMNFSAASLCSRWTSITRDQCLAGKIEAHDVVNDLLQHGSEILVAPLQLQKGQEYFVPLLLRVTLKPSGEFCAALANALPIVPRNLLEPIGLQSISLGTAEEFDNYFNLQPPCWVEDRQQLSWETQYQYANQMLSSITAGKWLDDLAQSGFELQNGALVFPVSMLGPIPNMDLKPIQNKSKLELIAAERNSGKSAYAKYKIAECWIEAAIKQAPPPGTVWLQGDQEARFTSIFACSNQAPIFATNSDHKQNQKLIHKELSSAFNVYIKGKQFLRNWQDIAAKLSEKYEDKGGISNRIKQLQAHLKEAHARYRHIQVLHSIYTRQSELISNWSKIFDLLQYFQNKRLQRLYLFFKQNFPNEVVAGLPQSQLDNLMTERINRARNSERFIADALHQAVSDQKQQELIAAKLLSWGQQHNELLNTNEQVASFIQDDLWQQALNFATTYWQLEFAISGQRNEFFTSEPVAIDLLIVEHAEYIDPLQAAQLLAKTQRAIIMGNYAAICNPRYAVAIDYELAKQARLANCDADYEDMQFEGISAALGNMWNLVANGKEPDKNFTSQQPAALEYEFCNIKSCSADYNGSKTNLAEIDALQNWLLRHNPDTKDVSIYTSFAGQAQAIRQRLQNSKYATVAIHLIYRPNIIKTKISIFTTVYNANDPGPYCFDRGVEILDNLRANTLQKLVIVGDRGIFKPELHSATGKFAKLLGLQTEKNKLEEVHNV